MIIENVVGFLKDIKVTKKGVVVSFEDVQFRGEQLTDVAQLIGSKVLMSVDIPQKSLFDRVNADEVEYYDGQVEYFDEQEDLFEGESEDTTVALPEPEQSPETEVAPPVEGTTEVPLPYAVPDDNEQAPQGEPYTDNPQALSPEELSQELGLNE